MIKKCVLTCAILALAGCSAPLDGTYADAMGMASYAFKPGGKVYVSVMGTEVEVDYAVEGDKVKLSGPQGNLIFTRLDDGSLQGPMGMKLTRQNARRG